MFSKLHFFLFAFV